MMTRTVAEKARRRLVLLGLLAPLAASCGGRGDADGPGPSMSPLADAAETITSEDMMARIGVLAHDSMRGRDTPSPGLEMAARYIVEEFQRMGLEGAAGEGEFIQRYPFPPSADTAAGAAGRASAPNVVALLRGSDPELADEYIVFSAHMDHVGVGRPDETGDSIYNGADDDASGTAALIEVAEAFTNLLQRPRRSLLFLAVSGEEKGLLGSRWFSDHPTVPLENMVANINVDMIGRNAPDTIVVIGQEYSSLGPTVHAVADARAELGLEVALDPWPEERFFFRSDHFNFARKEIPALFFFAGVHEDYHEPSDEVHLIDGDKAARVARLIFYTAHELADTPARPTWTEQGLAEIRALVGNR